jgi:hypothetical protein
MKKRLLSVMVKLCVILLFAGLAGVSPGGEEKLDPGLAKQLQILRHGKGKARYEAVRVIQRDFGPKALPILPQLLEIWGEEMYSCNPKDTVKATDIWNPLGNLPDAVLAIGDKAEQILLKAARYARPKTRTAALRALGLRRTANGPEAGKKTWPLIRIAMTDRSPFVRREAFATVRWFPEKLPEAMPLLIEALNDMEPGAPNQETVSLAAAQTIRGAPISGHGDLVKPAVPALLALAQRREQERVNHYFTVLGDIGWKVPSLRPEIYAAMMSFIKERPDLRWKALGTLIQFHDDAKKDLVKDLPIFINLMKNSAQDLKENRGALLYMFWHLGPDAAPAAPLIISALQNSKDKTEREYAVRALEKIGPAVPQVRAAVETAAKHDPDFLVRQWAELAIITWRNNGQ